MKPLGRMVRATLISTLALAAAAPAANAACPTDSSAAVFSAWGDLAPYVPAPNGDFESGLTGWTVAGDASLVADNAHALAQQANDVFSLELRPGSSVTSPALCVGSGSPTARMFALTTRRNPASGSTLQVEVLYKDATRGGQQVKKLGTAPDELAWDATRKLSLAQGQLSIKPDSDGNTYVRYRFTPLYRTTWRIDDLYVDPRLRS